MLMKWKVNVTITLTTQPDVNTPQIFPTRSYYATQLICLPSCTSVGSKRTTAGKCVGVVFLPQMS